MKITTSEARDWMKKHLRSNAYMKMRRINEAIVVQFKPTNAKLRWMLRSAGGKNPIPSAVKNHIYAWRLYRMRRRRAN